MNINCLIISAHRTIRLRFNQFLWLVAFLIPLVFSGPQIITGSIVNGLLFITAEKFPQRKWLPIMVLPSLAAVAHGFLFGSFTPFLIYFMPFIWLGNCLLMKIFSLLKILPFALRILLSAGGKSLLLFIVANIYFKINLAPLMFLSTMGMMQLVTAIIGGALAFVVVNLSFRGSASWRDQGSQ